MKKHFILITLCILGCTVFPFQLFAEDPIVIEGEWDDSGRRKLVTPLPQPMICGSTLSIYFYGPVSDITVSVMDEDGLVVYQTVVSSSVGNYNYELDWVGTSGNYQVLLEHSSYGSFSGSFTID